MVRNVLAISAFLAFLTACSSAQVASGVTKAQATQAQVQVALNGACAQVQAAEAIVGIAGMVPTVNNIEAYANSACIGAVATSAIVTAALNDPTTISWVENLATQLQAAVAAAKAA